MKIQNLKIKLIFIILFFSCEVENYEEIEIDKPLAECIDGHASYKINGEEYIYECDDYDLIGYISLDEMQAQAGNDCWGWTDPLTNKEYALMGLNNGTAIIDLSNPYKPKYLGKIPTQTVPSSWRDLKVFNNHLYIVSEAQGHGMQVFDLEQLRVVENSQNFTPNYVYSSFGSAHNIAINTETGYAYPVGIGSSGNPIGIYSLNINEPESPILELEFSDFGYTHDAQIIIYKGPDTDHLGKEIYVGSNENKVVFVDVSDKSNPKLISQFLYDHQYTHQSWLTDDHSFALLGDELDELDLTSNPIVLKENVKTRTVVIDIRDLDNPILHFNYNSDTEAIDHNGYVRGSKFYLASYTSGLRVIDISNIQQKNIVEIGYFDTHIDEDHSHDMRIDFSNRQSDPGEHIGKKGQEIEAFNGAWSVYPFFKSENIIISDINSGLFIVKKSN
jgi:choice-of-anchor B domain-containing protein